LQAPGTRLVLARVCFSRKFAGFAGSGFITWIKCGGRDLVEQGLEEMMIAAIDKGYSCQPAAKHPRRGQTTETSAHDQNVWKAL
jgi:hypothetical protein